MYVNACVHNCHEITFNILYIVSLAIHACVDLQDNIYCFMTLIHAANQNFQKFGDALLKIT